MIILASASPRRKELLEMMGFDFIVRVQNFDELSAAKNPRDYVMDIARQKAEYAQALADKADTIIAADTVVALEGNIMGKPKTTQHAAEMLASLSGKTHTVYTGVCVIKNGINKIWAAETQVEFYELSKQEIEDYIATGEPMDKAGAYGIQGKGAFLVKRINGDYYNVMGLPIAEVCRAIKEN